MSIMNLSKSILLNIPARLPHTLALAALFACAGLTGCVVVSSHTTTTSGHKIDADTFAQIEPGKSKEFVISLLGQPSEKSRKDDESDIWRWRYSENQHSASGFIVLFASNTDNRTQQTRCVEFKNGVVTRVWTE